MSYTRSLKLASLLVAASLCGSAFAVDIETGVSKKLAEYRAAAGVTAIRDVQALANDQPATAVYDLQGRRVSKPTRGVYIVGGRKVLVK